MHIAYTTGLFILNYVFDVKQDWKQSMTAPKDDQERNYLIFCAQTAKNEERVDNAQ